MSGSIMIQYVRIMICRSPHYGVKAVLVNPCDGKAMWW